MAINVQRKGVFQTWRGCFTKETECDLDGWAYMKWCEQKEEGAFQQNLFKNTKGLL